VAFDKQTQTQIREVASKYKIDPAALLAISEVESGGKPFVVINGRQEPIIRFEGHYFDRRLSGAKRDLARKQGLASPVVGGVKNPNSQNDRWTLLDRASRIDHKAALESVSWGLGQVMGSHWEALGYGNVDDLVNTARSSVGGQVELMVKFIIKNNLKGAIDRRDWAAFARGYNGPAYAKNAYDKNMAKAYSRYAVAKPPVVKTDGMLKMGSTGERVRAVQVLLRRAGFPVIVDGDFGPTTDRAVRSFQKANKLKSDGVVGPATIEQLDSYLQGINEEPGRQSLMEVQEVRDAAKVLPVPGLIAGLKDGLTDTATNLLGVGQEWSDRIAYGIMTAASLVALIIIGYGLVGWWRNRKTKE
jgi:hypothetical protein